MSPIKKPPAGITAERQSVDLPSARVDLPVGFRILKEKNLLRIVTRRPRSKRELAPLGLVGGLLGSSGLAAIAEFLHGKPGSKGFWMLAAGLGALGFGLFSLYALLAVSLGRNEILVDDKMVTVRRMPLPLFSGPSLPFSEIEGITVEVQGEEEIFAGTFNVVAQRKDLPPWNLVILLPNREQAQYIADEITHFMVAHRALHSS
jgi:hypothetical protein